MTASSRFSFRGQHFHTDNVLVGHQVYSARNSSRQFGRHDHIFGADEREIGMGHTHVLAIRKVKTERLER